MGGMSMGQLFFSFKGRINRQPFWLAIILMILLSAVLNGIIYSVVNYSDAPVVSAVVSLLFVYPALAVYAKRCHGSASPAGGCSC